MQKNGWWNVERWSVSLAFVDSSKTRNHLYGRRRWMMAWTEKVGWNVKTTCSKRCFRCTHHTKYCYIWWTVPIFLFHSYIISNTMIIIAIIKNCRLIRALCYSHWPSQVSLMIKDKYDSTVLFKDIFSDRQS